MLVSRYLDDRRTDLRKNTTIAVLSTSIRQNRLRRNVKIPFRSQYTL